MKRNLLPWVGAIAVAALILDGKTAVGAAGDAVDLCIRVLIPSLFPFFVFSPLLVSGGFGKLFAPLARVLRLPKGAESILPVSFLGGYPVGAAAVSEQVQSGALSRKDGQRMLAFCSNAGPSFLFGIGLQLFPSSGYCWLLWCIHILSAVTVALMTSGSGGKLEMQASAEIPLTSALQKAISVMAAVCGWVVLFRILIGFLDRWLLWAVPKALRILVCGILELANGYCELAAVDSIGLRMVLFSGLLAFGGLCVWLQTKSVTAGLDISLYLPGKLTQAAVSILLCTGVQFFLSEDARYVPPLWILLICIGICILYALLARKIKISSRNLEAAVV